MGGKDALGRRMKEEFEFRTRSFLPRRSYSIIRSDGKAFHSYTRGLNRPYDEDLMEDMALTAAAMCRDIQGVAFAYTQSDEISLVLTDFASAKTQAWFDGNVQKMASVSASIATAYFNAFSWKSRPGKLAMFDSRVFTIPVVDEVVNYFRWRQADATRNSIAMAAQAHFSHRELHGKSSGEMQDMLWRVHGINWNSYDPRFKRGTVVVPVSTVGDVEFVDKRTGELSVVEGVERRKWHIAAAPRFTQCTQFFGQFLPGYKKW